MTKQKRNKPFIRTKLKEALLELRCIKNKNVVFFAMNSFIFYFNLLNIGCKRKQEAKRKIYLVIQEQSMSINNMSKATKLSTVPFWKYRVFVLNKRIRLDYTTKNGITLLFEAPPPSHLSCPFISATYSVVTSLSSTPICSCEVFHVNL